MSGDMETATLLLGHYATVPGTVVPGSRRGRELGFPTANLALPPNQALPADGVYATWTWRPATGEMLPSVTSIGTRPTFDVRTQIPRPTPASSAELLAALNQSVATAKKILGGMGDTALTASWRMMDGDREVMAMPKVALLRNVLFNHWYHHRGQLTVYLRQVGALVPATYGASADENPLARY